MRTVLSAGVKAWLGAVALALAAPAVAQPASRANVPGEAAAPAPGEAAALEPGEAAAGPAPAEAVPADPLEALPEATPKGFTARVEPDKVELGRPFRLTLEVRHDPAERYALAGEPALGGLTLRAPPTVERTEADGTATTRIAMELAAFDALGDRELPEQVLIAEGPAGKARLAIPGPPLHVIATSEGEKLENPPPEPLVVIAWDRIAIAAGALLAVMLATLAWWRWRRRRPAGAGAVVELDRRTPEERALEALATIEAGGGLARERYFRLSEIVRGFLAEVSELPAVDRTTAELCDELARRAVPGLSVPSFKAWLERGDFVRFARYEPAPAEAAADLAEARATVRDVAAAIRAEEERCRAEAARAAAPGAGSAAPGSEGGPAAGAPTAPKAGEGGR